MEEDKFKNYPSKVLALSSITPHPENYVVHGKRQLEKLTASLKRFGQVKPIVVQEKGKGYMLVAGEGLYTAAKTLSWDSLEAKILPKAMKPEEIEGYLIADNLLAQGSQASKSVMAEILERQRDNKASLESIGSSAKEMRKLLSRLKQQKAEDAELQTLGFHLYEPDGEVKPVESLLEQFEQLELLSEDARDAALVKVASSKTLKGLVSDLTADEVAAIEERLERVAPAEGMKAMATLLGSETLATTAKSKIQDFGKEQKVSKPNNELVVGSEHLPISKDELELLSERVSAWRADMGTLYGFMGSLIQYRAKELADESFGEDE